MEDGTSTCTSADGTEDFGDNPTRDSLTEGILNLLKPTVDSLENSIKSTRYALQLNVMSAVFLQLFQHFRQSQLELRAQIESLTTELGVIAQNQQSPIDLESYIKKLLDARKRITIVNSILQNAQVCWFFLLS